MVIELYRQQRPPKSRFPLLVLAGGLVFFLFAVYRYFDKPAVKVFPAQDKVLSATLLPSQPSEGLARAVQSALAGTDGTYGIIVKNLKTGESYFQNEHRVFEPASVYKLWIMGIVFRQVQSGKFGEDDVLTADIAGLNKEFKIPEEIAEKTEGAVSLTVREAIFQMITISDNYAALLLTDKVGLKTLSSYLSENGFLESKVGVDGQSPTTTPWDTAVFLEKLYGGKLANQKYTQEMVDILKWQKLNDGLPKYLPDGVAVAHKTGEMESFVHDAGIVYSDLGDYVIVVFTETGSREQARERIAEVSRGVYKYFSL